jgi:hypothetical protein
MVCFADHLALATHEAEGEMCSGIQKIQACETRDIVSCRVFYTLGSTASILYMFRLRLHM